ncbi:MAG: glycogen/starch synthase [Zestosphaera sp.]
MVTFEYAGIKKVGGLGEAVKNISVALGNLGYEVTVVMPSHGVDLGQPLEGVVCSGTRVGEDRWHYPYKIGFSSLNISDRVKLILVRGVDSRTSTILEDPYVYGRVEEKACLLCRALMCLAEYLGFPDIIHSNDWHSALAAVALKIYAEQKGIALPHLHQIHLPGSPRFSWHYISSEWCGVPADAHRIWRVCCHRLENTYDLWKSVDGDLEAFAVVEADAVATVSRSMINELLSRYGDWIREKTCFIYNSTDWSLKEVTDYALSSYGELDRAKLRWVLIRDLLSSYSSTGQLTEGDALVLSTGRLTPQKGFEYLLRSFRKVPERLRLVILGISVGDLGYEEYIRQLVRDLDGRAVLITERVDPRTYKLLHYVANAFVVPSIYEPFGVVAIEAMAVGTPVVASNVGGLSEIVEDLRSREDGCGFKVQPGNELELSEAIQNLSYLTLVSELGEGFEYLTYDNLRKLASKNLSLGHIVRENCIKRVEQNFRIHHTAEQVIRCYELSRKMAYFRAIT